MFELPYRVEFAECVSLVNVFGITENTVPSALKKIKIFDRKAKKKEINDRHKKKKRFIFF